MKPTMRTYLSYGGGVNSTAMMLLLLNEGWEFEAVYVDHGCDWPETREYVAMLAERYPITILKPNYQGFENLYEYAWHMRMIPFMHVRWCTSRFKVRPLHAYFQKPCFELIGIDFGESKRARMSSLKGVESRWPLIEHEIDRSGCEEIISAHGLPVPTKSGCFICPFQRISQWKLLRRVHPELFCKAVELEKRNRVAALERDKKYYTLHGSGKPLSVLIGENQRVMWKEMAYPPCSCGL